MPTRIWIPFISPGGFESFSPSTTLASGCSQNTYWDLVREPSRSCSRNPSPGISSQRRAGIATGRCTPGPVTMLLFCCSSLSFQRNVSTVPFEFQSKCVNSWFIGPKLLELYRELGPLIAWEVDQRKNGNTELNTAPIEAPSVLCSQLENRFMANNCIHKAIVNGSVVVRIITIDFHVLQPNKATGLQWISHLPFPWITNVSLKKTPTYEQSFNFTCLHLTLPSLGKELFARGEDSEDRFANMLSEASQQLLKTQNQQQMKSLVNDDSSNDNMSNSPSPFSKDQSLNRRKKYENDDIPQEKVARIYQEEFSKLMNSREALPK